MCELVVSNMDRQSSFILLKVFSVDSIPVKPINAVSSKSLVKDATSSRYQPQRTSRCESLSLDWGGYAGDVLASRTFEKVHVAYQLP